MNAAATLWKNMTLSGSNGPAENITSGGTTCFNYTVYKPKLGPMDLTHIILQGIVFLLGLSGNLILIFIIATHRRLRTTPNLFITNLAAADCVYLLLFIPCDIIGKFGAELPLFFCKTIYFCRFLTVGVSVYTLLALSIDRCLAITRPMSNLKSSRPGLVPKLGLIVIWVASIALSIPYAVSTDIEEKRHRCHLIRHCYPFPSSWGKGYKTGMVVLKLILYYLLPGILIAIFYGLMAGKLMRTARAHERSANAEINSSATGQIEGRKKLAKLVLCLSGVFFVAWGLDYIVMLYFFLANRVHEVFVWIKMLAKLLPSAYSASNPITLCIISKRFRAHFLQVITYGRRPVNVTGTGGPGDGGGGAGGARSAVDFAQQQQQQQQQQQSGEGRGFLGETAGGAGTSFRMTNLIGSGSGVKIASGEEERGEAEEAQPMLEARQL